MAMMKQRQKEREQTDRAGEGNDQRGRERGGKKKKKKTKKKFDLCRCIHHVEKSLVLALICRSKTKRMHGTLVEPASHTC